MADEISDYKKVMSMLVEPSPRPMTMAIPGGFGASQGDIFGVVSYSDVDLQSDTPDDDDGSIILGFGLGNPNNNLAAEIAVSITSVSSPWWGDGKFADEGNVNLKLHQRVDPIFGGSGSSLSFGAGNILGWGGTVEIPTNLYFSYSEVSSFGAFNQYGLAYTLGYGSSVGDGEKSNNYFGGIGIARFDFNASLTNIGEETYLSGTYYIPQLRNVTLTYTRADLFDTLSSSRNIISIGYSGNIGR